MSGKLKINNKITLGKREVKLKILMGKTDAILIFLAKDTKTEERFTFVAFIPEKNDGECEKHINLLKTKNKFLPELLYAEYVLIDNKSSKIYHLLYELSPTTLQLEFFSYKYSEQRMNEIRILDIFDDLLNTVIVLHNMAKPVFLLKLSMDFILHTKKGLYKLVDFQNALDKPVDVMKLLPKDELDLLERISRTVPIPYRAPELVCVIKNKKDPSCAKITTAVDIWQLGCVLYQLLYYAGPFDNESEDQTYTNILNYRYTHVSRTAWDGVERERLQQAAQILAAPSKYLTKPRLDRLSAIWLLKQYFSDTPPSSKEAQSVPSAQLLMPGACGPTHAHPTPVGAGSVRGKTKTPVPAGRSSSPMEGGGGSGSVGGTPARAQSPMGGAAHADAVTTGARPMFSKDILALVDSMLEPNPDFRPSALQVMHKLCAMRNVAYPKGWPIPPPIHAPTYPPKHEIALGLSPSTVTAASSTSTSFSSTSSSSSSSSAPFSSPFTSSSSSPPPESIFAHGSGLADGAFFTAGAVKPEQVQSAVSLDSTHRPKIVKKKQIHDDDSSGDNSGISSEDLDGDHNDDDNNNNNEEDDDGKHRKKKHEKKKKKSDGEKESKKSKKSKKKKDDKKIVKSVPSIPVSPKSRQENEDLFDESVSSSASSSHSSVSTDGPPKKKKKSSKKKDRKRKDKEKEKKKKEETARTPSPLLPKSPMGGFIHHGDNDSDDLNESVSSDSSSGGSGGKGGGKSRHTLIRQHSTVLFDGEEFGGADE